MDLDDFAEDDGADDSVGSDIDATRSLSMNDFAKNAKVKKVIEIKMRPARKRGRAKAKSRGPAKKPAAHVGDDASAVGAAASSSSGAPGVGAASSSTGAHAEPMNEEAIDWVGLAPSSDEEEEELGTQKHKENKAKGRRERPGYPWGPFWIAPIKGGRSWGATCYKHHNPGDGKHNCCGKQLSISRCEGDPAQCRKALKAWLVVGAFLKFKTNYHRKEHQEKDPVQLVGDWEEADLDELAAQLV